MTLLHSPSTVAPAFFADDFAWRGDAPAVVTAEGSMSYAELEDAVADVAARLGTARRLVLLEASNEVGSLVTYLAALRGGHPLLLAPAHASAAVPRLISTYDPDVVVSAEAGWALDERRAVSTHRLHPDLALLLSTSGSTGSSKLVRLSRTNLESNAAAIAEYLGLRPDDRAMTSLPMQYCYGLSVINSHLHAGASVVLSQLSVVDRCFWDLFRSTGATNFAGVPHTFDLLDRVGFDSASLPTLRHITQAGGRMRADTVRRYAGMAERDGWQLFVMYGQTEATARMAYLPPQLAASHPRSIGLPIPGGRFSIDSPDDDGVGELVYRGANVMLGYAETPADLALGRTVDALHTGDLARVDASGLYEVVGRRSRFVKPYGIRIGLDSTEALLADHRITAACTSDGECLIVGVEDPSQVEAASNVLHEQLGLPRSGPASRVVPSLPRLANGKPDYHALRRHAAAPAAPTHAPSARTTEASRDIDRAIHQAFVETLGVDPSPHDSFVSLGGDSLSYVEMSLCLEDLLGSLPRDWHTRPVRELADLKPRRRWFAAVETSVVARAVAIVLIVGTHTKLWPLAGGAHVLLAVAGFNFARFHRSAGTVLSSVARVAVPSMLWISAVAVFDERWRWPNALLVNGWLGHASDKWGYWYIEALVQMLIPLGLLMAVPAVRRAVARAPFAVAMGALAIGLVIRFDVGVDIVTTRTPTRPHEIFWVFALGWAAAFADTAPRRLAISAVAIAAVPGFFGETPREVLIIAGILLLVWLPVVAVPRSAVRPIGWLAASSLYIYLTHFQIYRPVTDAFGPAAGLFASLAVGVGAWLVARRLMAAGEAAVRRAVSGGRTSVRVPSTHGCH